MEQKLIDRMRNTRINRDLKRNIKNEQKIIDTQEKIRKILAPFGLKKKIEIMKAVREIYG